MRSGRLGPVLWQLPPTFCRDDDRLAEALAQYCPKAATLEFRHPSWFAPEVLTCCARTASRS